MISAFTKTSSREAVIPKSLQTWDNTPVSKITPRIYLGGYKASEASFTRKLGITHIINAAIECNELPTEVKKINLDLDDVPGENLFRVLEPTRLTIQRILKDPKAVVLVHCAAGVSRSASVLIYYFMISEKLSYDEALDKVKQKRPFINPNIGFERTLRSIYPKGHP